MEQIVLWLSRLCLSCGSLGAKFPCYSFCTLLYKCFCNFLFHKFELLLSVSLWWHDRSSVVCSILLVMRSSAVNLVLCLCSNDIVTRWSLFFSFLFLWIRPFLFFIFFYFLVQGKGVYFDNKFLIQGASISFPFIEMLLRWYHVGESNIIFDVLTHVMAGIMLFAWDLTQRARV